MKNGCHFENVMSIFCFIAIMQMISKGEFHVEN